MNRHSNSNEAVSSVSPGQLHQENRGMQQQLRPQAEITRSTEDHEGRSYPLLRDYLLHGLQSTAGQARLLVNTSNPSGGPIPCAKECLAANLSFCGETSTWWKSQSSLKKPKKELRMKMTRFCRSGQQWGSGCSSRAVSGAGCLSWGALRWER